LANPDLLAQETKPMGETVAYFTHDLRRDYSIFRTQQLCERAVSARALLGDFSLRCYPFHPTLALSLVRGGNKRTVASPLAKGGLRGVQPVDLLAEIS
jgi:hypothetical protein